MTAIPSTIACQSKAGFAQLCGFGEFVVSDPPKLYRSTTGDGQAYYCGYAALGCGGGVSGTESWDAQALGTKSYTFPGGVCTPPDTSIPHYLNSSASGCGFDPSGTVDTSNLPGGTHPAAGTYNVNFWQEIVTATTFSRAYNDLYGCLGPPGAFHAYGAYGQTLSDEDTDDDAQKRATDAISAWSFCTLGCGVSCSAFRTDRTGTGATVFGFRAVQAKVSWADTAGPNSYKITTNFYRRLLGSSGPFLSFGIDERTLTFEGTILAPSEVTETPWIDVPNEAGWETIAGNSVVQIL